MELSLESLGLTKEALKDLVVEKLAREAMEGSTYEDGPFSEEGMLSAIEDRTAKSIKNIVEKVYEEQVLPDVRKFVEGLCLQETNKWGEQTGKKMTFTEFLVAQVDAYIREPLDHNGKTKADSRNSYDWKPSTTRVVYAIHEYMHHHIRVAMEDALKTANASIVQGIQEAATMKLSEIAKQLKVSVKT